MELSRTEMKTTKEEIEKTCANCEFAIQTYSGSDARSIKCIISLLKLPDWSTCQEFEPKKAKS